MSILRQFKIISLFVAFISFNCYSQIKEEAVIQIRGDKAYPPYEFINDKGEPDGFNIELIKAVMEILNLKYELQLITWDSAVSLLSENKIDMLTGLSISPARQEKFTYSIPHCYLFQSIICRKDEHIHTIGDVKNKEVLLISNDIVAEYKDKFELKNVVYINDVYEGLDKLSQGQYDAIICGDLIAKYIIRNNSYSNLEIRYLPEIDPWPYCFATHLENNELKEKLNLGVRMLSNSGQFNQIYYKWFIKPAEQPTKVFAIIIFVLLAISTASLIIIFIIRRHIRKVTAKLTILNNELKASIQSINLAIKTSEITRWDYNCLTQKFSTYNNQEGITDFELFYRILHPDDLYLFTNIITRIKECEDFEFAVDIRIKIKNKDSWKYVTFHGTPIKDKNDNVIKYTGFGRDNTKFLKLTERLKEKNIYLDMVLKSGDIIPIVLDTEFGNIFFTSKSISRSLFWSNGRTKISLSEFEDYVYKKDKEKFNSIIKYIDTEFSNKITEELRFMSSNGEIEYYTFTITKFTSDKLNNKHRFIGYFQNITESKNIQIRLTQQSEFLNNILNLIPIPVHIKNVEGKFTFWNKASDKLFGRGFLHTAFDLLEEDCAKEMTAIDKHIFETGESYVNYETVKMKNGKEYDTFVEKNIIYDGDQKSILVVRLDIGEKKDLYNKLKILKFSTQSLKTFTWTYHIDKQELVIEDGIENVYSLKIGKNNIQDFAKKIYSKDRKHFFDFWINFTKMNDDEGFINFRMDFFGTDEYEWWESRGKIETETINGKERKYIYGILINIESLKQTENILLENKLNLDALIRQNELIMNNVSVGLVYLDEKLKVQWNNFNTFLPNFFKGKSGCNCKNCDVENKILDFSNKNCFIIKSINLHKSQYKEMEFDGRIFEIASSPVSDNSNNFLGCVLRITDITERKHINNELINAKNKAVQSNLLMRNIFNMLPCLLFIKDVTDGFKYTFVNDKFCDNFNLNQEDILGKTDFEIYDSSIAQSFRDTDLKVIKDEEVHIFDIETPLNNKTLYLQKTKCCITAINGHKIIIGISFDVTDKINSLKELKKAKEKAEESNKLKSAFLANMSHEIRTPLNAIVGFSNILTEEELDDDERVRFCNLINLNNNLLLRLIGDILDLSKIEAGMMVFNPEKFEVSEIFENLKSSINQNINNKDVELLIDIPEKEYYLIHDRNRFIQVVSNFANNAVKFTNEGYIKLGFIPEPKGVTVYVEDTGIGIPEDKKERVFERFEKLNDFAQGTGLGMSICKAIMDSCGGKIGVDSVLGQGSRFWAWFPDKMSNSKK